MAAVVLLPLTAQAQNLAVTATALVAEGCPNGAIDPGEIITVNFTLTNLVSTATTNLIATLVASNGVVSPSGPQTYGALVGGGAAVTRAFTFLVAGQCGGAIVASLRLQDGASNLGIVSPVLLLGIPRTVDLSENFDAVTPPALPAGWTNSLTGKGTAWATTNAVRDTLPNSVFAPDPDQVSDNRLTSPPLVITTASARLAFRHYYNTEAPFDGGVLEISTNGGAFTDILTAGGSFTANGYNQTIPAGYGNPLTNRAAWSGNSGGFITTTVNLPVTAAGQTIQLRWRFGSDDSGSATGWYIDTITVNDGFDCCGPQPLIQSIASSNNAAALIWTAITGRTYRVQYKTNVTDTNWINVSGDVIAIGTTAGKTNSTGTARQRFYRVQLLP